MWVKCICAEANPIIEAIIDCKLVPIIDLYVSQVYPCAEVNPIIQAIIDCKLVPIIDLYVSQVYPCAEANPIIQTIIDCNCLAPLIHSKARWISMAGCPVFSA